MNGKRAVPFHPFHPGLSPDRPEHNEPVRKVSSTKRWGENEWNEKWGICCAWVIRIAYFPWQNSIGWRVIGGWASALCTVEEIKAQTSAAKAPRDQDMQYQTKDGLKWRLWREFRNGWAIIYFKTYIKLTWISIDQNLYWNKYKHFNGMEIFFFKQKVTFNTAKKRQKPFGSKTFWALTWFSIWWSDN